jgi:hypothetical protein
MTCQQKQVQDTGCANIGVRRVEGHHSQCWSEVRALLADGIRERGPMTRPLTFNPALAWGNFCRNAKPYGNVWREDEHILLPPPATPH